MFRAADLTLITKTDLLPYLQEFSPARAREYLRQVGFDGAIIELSNRGGDGFEAWLAWLQSEVETQRRRVARGESLRPQVQPEGAALHRSPTEPA
jgi:hydrogenase nickel incorporation protein HypB